MITIIIIILLALIGIIGAFIFSIPSSDWMFIVGILLIAIAIVIAYFKYVMSYL